MVIRVLCPFFIFEDWREVELVEKEEEKLEVKITLRWIPGNTKESWKPGMLCASSYHQFSLGAKILKLKLVVVVVAIGHHFISGRPIFNHYCRHLYSGIKKMFATAFMTNQQTLNNLVDQPIVKPNNWPTNQLTDQPTNQLTDIEDTCWYYTSKKTFSQMLRTPKNRSQDWTACFWFW